MYSALIYLNDCPVGGATRMMEESGEALGDHVQEEFVRDAAGSLCPSALTPHPCPPRPPPVVPLRLSLTRLAGVCVAVIPRSRRRT
jgi:hypothetical protein